MKPRLLNTLAIVLLCSGTALAVQSGDKVFLRMRGDLASEYAKAMSGQASHIVQVEVGAIVAQSLPDGRLRIEHSSPSLQREGEARLVTLSATVMPSMITSEITAEGTTVYAAPGSKVSTVTTKPTETLRVTLSNLKGVKLRTWKLASEIGE